MTFIGEVQQHRGQALTLPDSAKQQIREKMQARYPGAGLEFLIDPSADAIARELG
ncbi:MAG: hypothetical protein H6718_06180 [Polyangiaceae bacterium]|nr:hypothetical protein [Myxococcales bacterium]MCB9584965.1 hypothetical protein [Polyangiaceae bacterium]MCB9607462.1 hypothetical protein [Polyangiaceae bacterium]